MKSVKRTCVEGIYREDNGGITRIIVGIYRRGIFFCIPKLKTAMRVSAECTVEDIAKILNETSQNTLTDGMARKIVQIIGEIVVDSSQEDVTKKIIKNPSTIKQLAEQLIAATDAYLTLRIEENDLQNIILHYASKHCKKLFGKNGKINPTIRNLIGKKRRELVELMLRGYQLSLF